MYSIERIDSKSYFSIQSLYKLCFGVKTSMSSIQLKYDTGYTGLTNVGFLAKDENNEVAAFYGVFPTVLKFESNEYLIAQSGDTMTSPFHQKKGLFVRLAKETYILSEELGINLIFGFPNKNSFPGFKKNLDWTFHGNIQKFSIKSNTIPLCELSYKIKFIDPFYRKYVHWKLKDYKISPDRIDLNQFNFTNVKGIIKKDINYFNYKLRNRNCSLININGFNLLIKVENHLIIGDIGKFNQNDSGKLINTIKELAWKLGCRKAIIYLSKNHWLYNFLKDLVTFENSLPVGFKIINSDILPNDIQFIGVDFDTF